MEVKKKYQVGNDITTHWCTYFLLLERLKEKTKIFYCGLWVLVYAFLFLFWLNCVE